MVVGGGGGALEGNHNYNSEKSILPIKNDDSGRPFSPPRRADLESAREVGTDSTVHGGESGHCYTFSRVKINSTGTRTSGHPLEVVRPPSLRSGDCTATDLDLLGMALPNLEKLTPLRVISLNWLVLWLEELVIAITLPVSTWQAVATCRRWTASTSFSSVSVPYSPVPP